MKYCTHCGNALDDNAQICMSCGCPVENAAVPSAFSPAPAPVAKKDFLTKLTTKHWIIIAVSIVVLIGLIVGGIFLGREIKKQEIIKLLDGKTFTYSSYDYFGFDIKRLTFVNDREAEYYYYYSCIDEEDGFTWDYKIKFEGKNPYVDRYGTKYYIEFDKYGNIDYLYDPVYDEKYE